MHPSWRSISDEWVMKMQYLSTIAFYSDVKKKKKEWKCTSSQMELGKKIYLNSGRFRPRETNTTCYKSLLCLVLCVYLRELREVMNQGNAHRKMF